VNDRVWVIAEVVFAGTHTALIYLFIKTLLKNKSDIHIAWKITVFIAIVIFKFSLNFYHIENIFIITSVSTLSAFTIGKICFKSNIFRVAIVTAVSFAIGGILELLAAAMITSFHEIPIMSVMQLNIYRMQGRILTHLFFILVIILTGKFKIGVMGSMTIKTMFALCIPPIASILIVQQFASHIMATTDIPTTNEAITMLSIMVVNVLIFILIESIIHHSEKNRALFLINTQNEAHQKHIQLLVDSYEQIRTMSHDFKQQTTLLYTLCKEKECGKLLEALSEISNIQHIPFVIRTENIILDAVLSSKRDEAQKQGIIFKQKLEVEPNLLYMSMGICVLLGNAFDNAIEACMRSDNDEKLIEMDLRATKSKCMFRMRNTLGDMPQTSGIFLKTKKEDALRHGIGLQSMKQTVTELGGDLTYSYDDKYFILGFHIPVEQKNN